MHTYPTLTEILDVASGPKYKNVDDARYSSPFEKVCTISISPYVSYRGGESDVSFG